MKDIAFENKHFKVVVDVFDDPAEEGFPFNYALVNKNFGVVEVRTKTLAAAIDTAVRLSDAMNELLGEDENKAVSIQ